MNIEWLSYRKPWLWCGLALLLYTLAGFLLAPWLLERSLESTLRERLSLTTTVDRIRVNPFGLTLTVEGLEVTEADGSPLATLERLFVNFELSSLFRWAFSFDELHIVAPHVAAVRFAGTDTNFSRIVERWRASAPPADPDPAPEAAPPPRIYVEDFRLERGGLSFTDHDRAEPFVAQLGPIDLAVTELSTLPDATGAQQVQIETESGATLGWSGTLKLVPLHSAGSVSIRGSHMPLAYRYLREELPFSFDKGEADLGLDYVVALAEDGTLTAELTKITGEIRDLEIAEVDGPPIAVLGRQRLENGSFRWPAREVHLDALRFTDVGIDLRRANDGRLNVVPERTLPDPDTLPDVAATPPEAATVPDAATQQHPAAAPEAEPSNAPDAADTTPWQIAVDVVELSDWRIRFEDERVADGRFEISDLDVRLANVTNSPSEPIALESALAFGSGGALSLQGQVVALPELDASVAIDLQSLSLTPLQPYLAEYASISIDGGTIGLKGTLASNKDAIARYRGDFRLDGLEIHDVQQDELLFSLKALAIDELAADPRAIELSSLTLREPYARIEIEEDGSTNLGRTLVERAPAPAADAPASTAEEETAASPPPSLTIGAIAVENASAHFTDLALPLPFVADIVKLGGKVSTISTVSDAPADVALEGQVNEWGSITVSGAIRPWAVTEQTNLAVSFRNVEMPSVSPYTIRFAGREIAEGRSDLDLTYAIENGKLEGSNHLVINDFLLGERVEHPDAMSLPLDLAVALLKDSEGRIDLDVPVSGSLDDPEFSYGKVIWSAIANVIIKIVASPFRLLGSLVGMDSEDLASIKFSAGRSDLAPPEREKILKIAEALGKRPQLGLEIPGVTALPLDEQALREAQLEAAIEAGLGDVDTDSQELLTERRRRVLESLYDAAGLSPERSVLRESYLPPEEVSPRVVDEVAYAQGLRDALLERETVAPGALDALAAARSTAVIEALVSAGVDASRLSATENKTLDDAESVEMPLAVSVED